MNQIIFHPNDNLANITNNLTYTKTMFTEWMNTNKMHKDARMLIYPEFPTKWVWQSK